MARPLLTRALAARLMTLCAALWVGPLLAESAAASPAAVRVSPASPLSSASFTARWRAPEARRKGRRYSLELRISARDGSLCTTTRTLAIRRPWNKSDTLTFRLRANDMTLGGESLWCPGRATLKVSSTKPGTRRMTHATLRFRVREDPLSPVPKGTPVEAEILEGSQLTVQAAGRPERTSTLSGKLTGYLPGAADPRADIAFELIEGALAIDALSPDPLCTPNARTGANHVDLASSGSPGKLLKDGSFAMTLRIAEDPIGLTGCQGPGGAAGLRSVQLRGRGMPDGGLSRVEATGTIIGVSYSDGTEARVVITLVLGFDLSPQ